MLSRLAFAALATALVSACAGAPPASQQWTRKDATPEDVKRDLYWCTRQERERPRVLGTPAMGAPRVTNKVDDECMEKRGYSKVAPKS